MGRREKRSGRGPNRIKRVLSGMAMVIAAIGPLACSSDPTVPLNALPEALFGNWSWTVASGGEQRDLGPRAGIRECGRSHGTQHAALRLPMRGIRADRHSRGVSPW
jgi:hypothetical protein